MFTPVKAGVWVETRLGPDAAEPVGYLEIRWRELTYAEVRRYRESALHPRLLYCEIYEKCVVHGPKLDDVPAGIVCWIGQALLDSPFNGRFPNIQRALEAAREKVASSWYFAARAVVASTFRYTFEEIDIWPPGLFFERVAQAEMLTGVPLNAADPSQPAKPQASPKRKR